LLIRPVIVFKSRKRKVLADTVKDSEQYSTQMRIISQFAIKHDWTLESPRLIVRTQANFDAATNNTFLTIMDAAHENNEMILVDDFIRLINCRDISTAAKQTDYLRMVAKNVYCIQREKLLVKIPKEQLQQILMTEFAKSNVHSKHVKAGLLKNAEFIEGPTKKAREKGAKMRKLLADNRAQELVNEIAAAKAKLPSEKQSNFSAIARILNEENVPTPSRKGTWQGITVKRVLERV
jgi:hypothetical protein